MSKNVSVKPKTKPYSRMTKAERKVAIAKDVIGSLHAMSVMSGNGYITENETTTDLSILREFGISDKLIAGKAKEKCTVCARGAMMLCKIEKFNHFGFDKCVGYNHDPIETFDDISQDDTAAALADAFTEDELDDIEGCFELCIADNREDEFDDDDDYDGYYIRNDIKTSYGKAYHKYQKHWEDITDDKDRLMAIMQNIVDHKGEFKPEVPYVVYMK